MIAQIKKIWKFRWILRSIIPTIYFNFHYLPIKHAIKLPILLYKPRLLKCRGKIIIDTSHIHFGMIRLGENIVSFYPNTGTTFENLGGNITFKGKCRIGNNSALAIGPKGNVIFENGFQATTTLHLIGYNNITFDTNVLVGWECTFMDTDLHKLTKLNDKGYSKGYGNIYIGKNNWFGTKCIILKNSHTPDFVTFCAGSILNGVINAPSYSVIGSDSQLTIKRTKVYLNLNDDQIEYN